MVSFTDLHCHLLAGLDDGPRTEEDALAMCRISCEQGIRLAAAGAHQNDCYPGNTPERLRQAAQRLTRLLQENDIPLAVFPCAEVMVRPGLDQAWRDGELLSVGDHGKHLLIELPNGLYLDLHDLVRDLGRHGVCPILAHPERHPELLHDAGRVESLIEAGCLMQVSSGSVTQAANRGDLKALKDWFERGVVHFLGSDAHSTGRRKPRMLDAYQQIKRWVGGEAAGRICGTNGLAVAQGHSLRVPPPQPRRKRWLSFFG